MLKKIYPLYVGNQPRQPNRDLAVKDKFSLKTVAHVAVADRELIDKAIGLAVNAAGPMRDLAAFERRAILNHCVQRFEERKEELVHVLCIEGGKPKRDAANEVGRLIETFRTSAEESVRMYGEVLPVDMSDATRGYRSQWKRFPIGPCSFISPFNFPLNLVAHKIAPAIAAGCPFVLKPASFTPISALILGEILAETDLPKGAFSILPCHRDGAALFTTDERLKLLSFTGSPAVGWELKKQAGKKKVVLELGGNAACIVDADWDIKDAVTRILVGGFAQSGQSCISVQRVLVQEDIYAAFRKALVKAVSELKTGNPSQDATVVGPLISEEEAERLEKWIKDAVAAGAKLLTGGKRKGALLEPTVVENVPPKQPLWADEAFGPVVVLESFKDYSKALSTVNATRFGLQAGVFTKDIHKAYQAWETLEVGGVVVGDVPSWRADAMPYGGVKESGLGREGVRFAMEDMTEIRMFVLRGVPK
jgi:acyl-CoA reductase-like NAD-dependent aldehyde dehydrogenase